MQNEYGSLEVLEASPQTPDFPHSSEELQINPISVGDVHWKAEGVIIDILCMCAFELMKNWTTVFL
jgi:hypothetical protein